MQHCLPLQQAIQGSMLESLFGGHFGRLGGPGPDEGPKLIVAEDGMWRSRRASAASNGTLLPHDVPPTSTTASVTTSPQPPKKPISLAEAKAIAQQRLIDAQQQLHHEQRASPGSYEVDSCCEVFSSSYQRWFVASVIDNDTEVVTVRFFVDDDMKEKSLRISDPMLAPLETNIRDMPPHFECVPSTSRPGEVSYLELATGIKYLDLQCAWQVHYKSILPPSYQGEDMNRGVSRGAAYSHPLPIRPDDVVSPTSDKTLPPAREPIMERKSPFAKPARDAGGALDTQIAAHPYSPRDRVRELPREVLPVPPVRTASQAPVDGYAAAYSSQKMPLPAFGEMPGAMRSYASSTMRSQASSAGSLGTHVQVRGARNYGGEGGHKTALPSFGVVSNQNAYLTAHRTKMVASMEVPKFPDDSIAMQRERPGDAVKRQQESELFLRKQQADPFLNWRNHDRNAPPSYDVVREPAPPHTVMESMKSRETPSLTRASSQRHAAALATHGASQASSSYISHENWKGPEMLTPSAPGLHPRFRLK
eukprot:GEMP01036930.1.p1 GENE.GEMP01036930.1~~GEMP01036930.1.p1  ORF type:complete len:534 (+),score=129.81 GEMP01036930.1:50-1651(+)